MIFTEGFEVRAGGVVIKRHSSTHFTLNRNMCACIMIMCLKSTHIRRYYKYFVLCGSDSVIMIVRNGETGSRAHARLQCRDCGAGMLPELLNKLCGRVVVANVGVCNL